jgi:hypothetical protein
LGPSRGIAVARTLQIVSLKRNHLADKEDCLIECLPSRANVFCTNGQVIDVWMEYGRQHDAPRHLFWIRGAQGDLGLVEIAFLYFSVLFYQSFDVILDNIFVGWVA